MNTESCEHHDEYRRERCFAYNDRITVSHKKFPSMIVTADTVVELFEAVHELPGFTNLPEYSILQSYGLCPNHIFGPFEVEAWNLYHATGGLQTALVPSEYYSLPSIYVDACNVISQETAKWAEVKRNSQ